ncbi:MAG: cardiolipin synthase [Lachnospiraceae bacterium]|nr:cardiolipin synthase [Lachnospiraceae bacterium]
MRSEEKSIKNSVGRLTFVAIAVLSQVGWLAILALRLNEYSVYISLGTTILTVILVLWLYNTRIPMGFKLLWIMVIMAFPVLGLLLYLMIGRSSVTKGMRLRLEKIDAGLEKWIKQDEGVLEALKKKDISIANQMNYVSQYGKFPVYQNTDVKFYKDASDGFEEQLLELEKAEKFIFMEYHAIEDAVSFGRMKEILAKKAAQGVDVRVLYDDIGSIGFIDSKFVKRMEALGIKCRVFNPLVPIINIFMNNRDHRKITVIDGKVGFTGGYNLADKYFNLEHPYGHWKDTGIRMEGDAVRNLTFMFLEMWSAMSNKPLEETDAFFPETTYQVKEKCYIQPYGDSPLDDELVGENVYMNVVKMAKNYVYFTTPYLIISDEMERELTMAVKRGVDVRIITPGIPDKKSVFEVTRSNYEDLVKAGVRIYEYTPGFIHAKECICDDEIAVTGTINLDYRSLYLHFENGVLMYQCQAIKDMKADYEETMKVSKEVTEDYKAKQPFKIKIKRGLLRVFAPLL